MPAFSNQLKLLRKEFSLSQQELAQQIGISKSSINMYERGEREPGIETLEAFADYFNVDMNYLLGFQSQKHINNAFSFSPPNVTQNYVTFPVIGDIAAGYDHIGMEDWEGDVIDIPLSFLKGREKKEFFVLRVKGDSMFPTYQDGDRVLILKQSALNYSGQVGAILYDGENTSLKKVEFVNGEDWLRMVPINPNHPPKRIEGAELERCRILGIPKVLIRGIEE